MFAKAYQIATQFTALIVCAFHRNDGACGSMLGTIVYLNDEGWALTAWHIVRDIVAIERQVMATKSRVTQEATIRADATIPDGERRAKLKALGKPRKEDADAWFVLPGQPGALPSQYLALEAIDLAVLKIDNLDFKQIGRFATIKDPTRGFGNGTSLCKLGFPFHVSVPTYDSGMGQFNFPPKAFPIPFFPIEGILTRFIDVGMGNGYPLHLLETSSPGLKGQSGGPILDREGSVWAIQSYTVLHDMGFDPPGPDKKPVRQFLSTGVGIHADTIVGFLNEKGIKYQLSNY